MNNLRSLQRVVNFFACWLRRPFFAPKLVIYAVCCYDTETSHWFCFLCAKHLQPVLLSLPTCVPYIQSACTKKIEAGRDLFLKSGFSQQEIIEIRVGGGIVSHLIY